MNKEFIHTTKDGQEIPLSKMGDGHLINTIKLILRRSKEGIKIQSGGGAVPEEFWYDEEILHGEEALIHLNYGEYMAELKRRKLTLEATR